MHSEHLSFLQCMALATIGSVVRYSPSRNLQDVLIFQIIVSIALWVFTK